MYRTIGFFRYLWDEYFDRSESKTEFGLPHSIGHTPKDRTPYAYSFAHLLDQDPVSLLDQRDRTMLRQCGLEVETVLQLPIVSLKFQYRKEWEPDPFLVNKNGTQDRSIINSPAFHLLETFRSKGCWYLMRNLYETDYYKMYRWREKKGFYFDWVKEENVSIAFSEKIIIGKVLAFLKTYKSIEKDGYLGKGFERRPIIALNRPYEEQRFGRPIDIEPYEIWSGHHRASCLAALGYESAIVVIAKFIG